jgi:Ser/Thr protein kinase RdoA (MazF antagonist)
MEQRYIEQALTMYGVKSRLLLPSQRGYRNENHPVISTAQEHLNLIIYKREPGSIDLIQNANYVSNYVAKQGMPARTTHSSRILQLTGQHGTYYASLYSYLPGSTIAWEGYTMAHLKTLGMTLAKLHGNLQPLARGNLPNVSEQTLELSGQMQTYYQNEGVRVALDKKLGLQISPTLYEKFNILLKLAKSLPNQQPLHMDFVRGNILFTDKAITGILDFEKAAYGHPYFDIARTLAFLLVDCKYKPEAKIRKYFLASGYAKKTPLRLISINKTYDLLEDLVTFYLLHDLYKFLRHNPYESLEGNEHYVRTRVLLVNRINLPHKDVRIIITN